MAYLYDAAKQGILAGLATQVNRLYDVLMVMRVLVTGMSGLIGSALRTSLESDYQLSALNRSDVVGIPTTRASLGDLDAISTAFEGQDLVVHLAAKISDDYGWDDLLETNVIGTRNVLEAAARSGVKRVVFTSSGATVAGWELESPYSDLVAGRYDSIDEIPLIDESMPTRPRNLYASTKVWGEAIGRHYADNHHLEVVCLRIGFANAVDKPENARQFSVWNSQRDVVKAIRLAMTSAEVDAFDTFFILSDNRWAYRSIDKARHVLGYEPSDRAEDFR